MLMKSIAAGLAGTALLATVAFAQNPTATTDKSPPRPPPRRRPPRPLSGDWRASKMVGLKVYNDANENIGSINDLLMDKSGDIKIAVIGVGGFLGMGEHLVAVPYDKLKFVNEAVAYTGTGATTPAAEPADHHRRCDRHREDHDDYGQDHDDDDVDSRMVSGPRRVQRDQGRAEEHARVQILGVMRLLIGLNEARPVFTGRVVVRFGVVIAEHCGDEAIQAAAEGFWIASLRSQ